MDDETSSDEDRSKFLQAVDKQFVNDDWYSSKISTTDNLESKVETLPPSLRNTDNEQCDQSTVLGLNVTPEFQKHVAKHLSILIDKQLKEVEPKKPRYEKKLNKKKKKGVRLLHSSLSFLDVEDPEDFSAVHNAKRRFRSEAEVDSEEESARVRETAVSADWVVNGEATKGWVKSTKGEVIAGVHKNSEVNGKSKKKKKKKIKEENTI
uniref:Protein CUSTOS n=1 Tax=Cuerna arida TaxID=1464854 RepID=A0A1B6FF67_9HEMI